MIVGVGVIAGVGVIVGGGVIGVGVWVGVFVGSGVGDGSTTDRITIMRSRSAASLGQAPSPQLPK